jgi:hypothetical protein
MNNFHEPNYYQNLNNSFKIVLEIGVEYGIKGLMLNMIIKISMKCRIFHVEI